MFRSCFRALGLVRESQPGAQLLWGLDEGSRGLNSILKGSESEKLDVTEANRDLY